MKLTLDENKLGDRAEHFLRQKCGYAFLRSKHTGKESYARRLTADHYPRFHIYIERNKGNVTFDLHLDQKEVSYKGNNMHNGEYDGPTVKAELVRIKQLIVQEIKGNVVAVSSSENDEQEDDEFKKVGHGTYSKDVKKKKGFFSRLFGN